MINRQSHPWYHTALWRRKRERFLSRNPFCAKCERSGRIKEASVVDHKEPHKGNWELFINEDNLQSLCATCHSAAKQIEDNRGFSHACDVNGFPLDEKHPWREK